MELSWKIGGAAARLDRRGEASRMCAFSESTCPVPAPGEVVAPGMRWRYPSILLFAERATTAAPGFELTPAAQARG
jgi:hypothetical protein